MGPFRVSELTITVSECQSSEENIGIMFRHFEEAASLVPGH